MNSRREFEAETREILQEHGITDKDKLADIPPRLWELHTR